MMRWWGFEQVNAFGYQQRTLNILWDHIQWQWLWLWLKWRLLLAMEYYLYAVPSVAKKNTFTQIYWMSWSKNEWTRISFSRTSKTIYHRAITPLSRLRWEEKQPKRHTVHHRLGINISPITMYSVLFNNPQRIFCRLCIYWKQPTNVSPSTVQMICLLTFGFCQTNKYKYTKKTRDRKKYDCFFFVVRWHQL